jgi:hypothetical protein
VYVYEANDKYVALPAEFISGDVPAGE